MKKRNIILMQADIRVIKRFINRNPAQEETSWIYFGKNVILCQTIKNILGKKYHQVMIGEELQKIGKQLRQEYIDYIGAMNHANATGNSYWWLTSISEKNPFVSDFFNHVCYLKLCMEIIENHNNNLIIICETPELFKSIINNIKPSENILVQSTYSQLFFLLNRMRLFFQGIKNNFVFIIEYTLRILSSRFFAFYNQKKRIDQNQISKTLIYTWVDDRSFSDSFEINDVYYGDLRERIERKGRAVAILANILPTMNYLKAIHKLTQTKQNIILLEEFITFKDIFHALIIHQRLMRYRKNNYPFLLNLDISKIISLEVEKDRHNSRAKKAYLSYQAYKKIGEKIQIDTFIYTFENGSREKMVCLALKQRNPTIILTGYAHSVVNPMDTMYSLSGYEREITPLPDRILVNGKRARNLLIGAGFDERIIHLAGAIRYINLLNKNMGYKNNIFKTNFTILVTPTAGINETVELVSKVINAFSETSRMNIIVKPHPTLPVKKLRSYLPELPPHFSIHERPVTELLPLSDLLIYTDTTVSIEALAQGIPVLHIASDVRIDMNPLEGYECIPSVSRPNEIREAVDMLLQRGADYQKDYHRIASDFFEEVRDDVVDIFLGRKKE